MIKDFIFLFIVFFTLIKKEKVFLYDYFFVFSILPYLFLIYTLRLIPSSLVNALYNFLEHSFVVRLRNVYHRNTHLLYGILNLDIYHQSILSGVFLLYLLYVLNKLPPPDNIAVLNCYYLENFLYPLSAKLSICQNLLRRQLHYKLPRKRKRL